MAKKVMKKYQAGGATNAVDPNKLMKPGTKSMTKKEFDKMKPAPGTYPTIKPVRPPKSTRKAGPTTPPKSMMRKGGSMRGKSC